MYPLTITVPSFDTGASLDTRAALDVGEDWRQAVLPKARMDRAASDFHLVAPRAAEAEAISALLTASAPDCVSLAKEQVLSHLSEFEVLRHRSAGVIAISAMRQLDQRRGEIRSIAVHPDWKGRGLGKLIVRRALFRALQKQLRPVCVTRRPSFFSQMGFYEIPLGSIPEKKGVIAATPSDPPRVAMSWSGAAGKRSPREGGR